MSLRVLPLIVSPKVDQMNEWAEPPQGGVPSDTMHHDAFHGFLLLTFKASTVDYKLTLAFWEQKSLWRC